jgi:hypothetical protein
MNMLNFVLFNILRGAQVPGAACWWQPASAALKLRLDMGLQRPTSTSHPSRRNSQLISSTTATMQKSCSPSSLRAAVRTKRSVVNNTPLRQHISDITITRYTPILPFGRNYSTDTLNRTGKPIIRTSGGRSVLLELGQLSFF